MIPYIETHIVDHCNLKCKGCSHFSGLATPSFKSLDEFEKEIKRLSEFGVGMFRILGGEPLLHPQVVDFCVIARQYLPQSYIVLVTNGILITKLTDEQIQILNNNQIILCISSYGLKLSITQLNKFQFLDYPNPNDKKQMYNICLDLKKKQNAVQSFQNCDLVQGGWYFLKEGRLYQCCIMANIQFFNQYFNQNINIDMDDISINIFEHTEEELFNFLHTPHDACTYCNTIKRHFSYSEFEISKRDINEWI